MNPQEEGRIKLKLYREFDKENNELYKRDIKMYFYEQNRYVEKRFLEVKHKLENLESKTR